MKLAAKLQRTVLQRRNVLRTVTTPARCDHTCVQTELVRETFTNAFLRNSALLVKELLNVLSQQAGLFVLIALASVQA